MKVSSLWPLTMLMLRGGSGEQEVQVEQRSAAPPEDGCMDREQGRVGVEAGVRLFAEFQVFLPSVQGCLDTSERAQEPQQSLGCWFG